MSAEPAWKRLVRDLKDRGFESQYLDRLYERLSPAAVHAATAAGFRALEREIVVGHDVLEQLFPIPRPR